jgi:hypothetical protein
MQCEEKTQYSNEADAVRTLHMARKQPNKGHALRRLGAYLCPACGFWHIGHHAARMKPISAEQQKPTTSAVLRRKSKHEEKHQTRTTGRGARRALSTLGYNITAITEAARIAKAAVDDLADSLAIAQGMTEHLFGKGRQDR